MNTYRRARLAVWFGLIALTLSGISLVLTILRYC